MRNEAITLVFAMGIGTVLVAAYGTPEQQAAISEPALGAPTPAERNGAEQLQGYVDPKEPAQRKDFEQKKDRLHWEYVPLPEGLALDPAAVQAAIPSHSLA